MTGESYGIGRRPAPHDIEKLCVGMVPGVTRDVMRRRGQIAPGIAALPVRLTFKARPVTGGAFRRIDALADRNRHRILPGQILGRDFR